MIIKLVKDVKDTKVNSVVEVDEITAKGLIESKDAIEYTDEVKELEKSEAIKISVKASKTDVSTKNINILVKEKNMENQEYKLAKLFKGVVQKAITGNSETGANADGGYLVHTGLADMAPTLTWGSQVFNKCRRIPVSLGANSMKVPVSINSFVKATQLAVTNPAEGSAGTNTKAQLTARTLTLTKSSILVPVTNELLTDVPSFDAWLNAEMRGKMAMNVDYEVLLGSTAGYTGVNDDTGFTTGVSISSTPTLAELQNIVSSVWQGYNAEWYMSITLWKLMVNTFATNANLEKQLIDIGGYKLLSKQVNVIPTMGAADLVYGDFGQYTVIGSQDEFSVSREVRFLEDETVFKLSHRGAGAATVKALTTGDALAIGAFACKS